MIGPQQNLDLEEIEKKKIYGTNISRESFVRMVEETIREVEESQRMVRPPALGCQFHGTVFAASLGP